MKGKIADPIYIYNSTGINCKNTKRIINDASDQWLVAVNQVDGFGNP